MITDITGHRFGMLVALRPIEYRPGGTVWECKCDCGKTTIIYGRNLRTGRTKSCGCNRDKAISANITTHGDARRGQLTSEFRIWRAMRERCSNSNNKSFKDYGGRGIRVCERWESDFRNFLEDMGRRPSPRHSIDRFPDNDGNYEPGNCRWATPTQQRNNRRDSKPKSSVAA